MTSVALLTQDLHDDPLAALAVELGVVYLLPGSEVEPSLRDGHDDLVVYEEAFEV